MNLKSRLKKIERNTPQLKRPPRGSTRTDHLLSMLAGIAMRREPDRHAASQENATPLEYAEIQRTIALADQRWDEAKRWQAQVDHHTPAEVKADPPWGRLKWIRQRNIARMQRARA